MPPKPTATIRGVHPYYQNLPPHYEDFRYYNEGYAVMKLRNLMETLDEIDLKLVCKQSDNSDDAVRFLHLVLIG